MSPQSEMEPAGGAPLSPSARGRKGGLLPKDPINKTREGLLPPLFINSKVGRTDMAQILRRRSRPRIPKLPSNTAEGSGTGEVTLTLSKTKPVTPPTKSCELHVKSLTRLPLKIKLARSHRTRNSVNRPQVPQIHRRRIPPTPAEFRRHRTGVIEPARQRPQGQEALSAWPASPFTNASTPAPSPSS